MAKDTALTSSEVKKSNHARRVAAQRQIRKERGLCVTCGNRPLVTQNHCEVCGPRSVQHAIRRNKAATAAGLCAQCKQTSVVAPTRTCDRCRKRKRDYMAAVRIARRESGLCVRCGKAPSTDALYRCSACKQHKNTQYKKEREQMLDAYGRVCACCGETEVRFLTLDHLRDDGNIHRSKVGKRGVLRNVRLQGYPTDAYALMCYNCNCGRANNGGVCPHQQRE